MAIVVASYLPGEGPCLRSTRFELTRVECRGPYDYWRGLAKAWATDETVLNVEHDIELYDADIDDLLDCPHPLCTRAYECHWITTSLPRDVFPMGHDRYQTDFTEEGTEWANWSAIGCIKVAPEARSRVLLMARWQNVEMAVEETITPPWHVHWPPLKHHHW